MAGLTYPFYMLNGILLRYVHNSTKNLINCLEYHT